MTRTASLAAVAVAVLVATSLGAAGALAATGSTPAATDSTVALQDNETNETMGNDTNETNATMGNVTNATANVTFVDQTSNGTTVYVNNTTLSEGGFIAIHLVENETFGAVVGNSSYLEPGTSENVTVTLEEPINESQTLIAMPHLDTNDNQLYEFPEADDPYLTANGTPVTDDAFVAVEMANATMGNVTEDNVTDDNVTMDNETVDNETMDNETMNATAAAAVDV